MPTSPHSLRLHIRQFEETLTKGLFTMVWVGFKEMNKLEYSTWSQPHGGAFSTPSPEASEEELENPQMAE